MNNKGTKVSRGCNYLTDEKLKLVHLVKKYQHVIENKSTDSTSLKNKSDTWKTIETEYNENPLNNVVRDNISLKNQWSNMKAKARKHYAESRRETFATGGGKSKIQPDPVSDAVHDIIGVSIDGLQNPFDSDCVNPPPNIIDQFFLEDDENVDPNAPVFEHLLKNNEVESWDTWNSAKLKKPISSPLENVTAGARVHKRKLNEEQRSETLVKTKIDLLSGISDNVEENQKLEKKLLYIRIQKEMDTQRMEKELFEIRMKKQKLNIKYWEEKLKRTRYVNSTRYAIEADSDTSEYETCSEN